MDNNRTKSEAEMDSVQLLASMLLCYPPITKVVLEPGGKSIALCFSMKKVPDPETFPAHQDFILDSLRLYHDIECSGQVHCKIFFRNGSLQIVRDPATLSRGELGLLAELVADRFADNLEDADCSIPDREIASQADMIDHRISSLRANPADGEIIGIREDGRVMVFDK